MPLFILMRNNFAITGPVCVLRIGSALLLYSKKIPSKNALPARPGRLI